MGAARGMDFTTRETRILDAAMFLMIHYGYDKTSVAETAREAGISKGAVDLRAEFIRIMQERGAVREDVEPYITAFLMSVFVMGTTTMERAREQISGEQTEGHTAAGGAKHYPFTDISSAACR